MRIAKRAVSAIQALTSVTLIAGCGASYEPGDEFGEEADYEIGSAEQELSAACGGDDSNALTAALAVAVANELGRWDVNTDFEIKSGKLELSTTGKLHCGTGCGNITALLRLQDDASSVIKNHSPSTYRNKLNNWYGAQKSKLDNLVVNTMLHLDKGVYRIKSVSSGKYVVPAGGSTSSGAQLQQSDQYTGTTAAQWRVVLENGVHQVVNVKSGLCMALTTNSNAAQNLVQSPCNTGNFSQGYRFAELGVNTYAIRTAHLQAAEVGNASTSNNAGIMQAPFSGTKTNQRFLFERVSGSVDLKAVATAVYSMKLAHSGQSVGVSSGSLADGTTVVQQAYAATDDRFHWYVTPADATRYQFINRRTGSCLDLSDPNPNSSTSKLVQKKCSTAQSQRFFFTPTGEGTEVIWSATSQTVGVPGGSTSNGAQLAQVGTAWQAHNKVTLTPITAGEPHRLKFSRKASGGPCGDYYWYDVSQPNGVALDDPASTFVQLIFAGGKQTPTGADANPFIAQQVSGNQVAIDPTYGLNDSNTTITGGCNASCVKVSTANVAGQCCSCSGATKKFVKATWNATTYVCQ